MAKLGIDLGTSNSAVAILFKDDMKEANIVRPSEGLSDGAKVFPSYIAFDNQGNVSAVGLRAKERYRDGATEFVVRHFKRLIGRPYDYVAREIAKGTRFFDEFKDRIERGPHGEVMIRVAGKTLSVVEITSFLLRKMIEDTESMARGRWRESITGAVISLPAEFDDSQRAHTLKAVQASGLENVKVIEEPTAAAIARGVQGATGKIMVVDVGAGTTDIVVGHIGKTAKGLRLIMSSRMCDGELGGLDMDYLILEYLLEKEETEPRLRDIYPVLDDKAEKGRLMAAIKTAKINTTQSGAGYIATILQMGKRKKKIYVPINEDILNEIVSPLLYGYKKDGRLKGIRPLVENVLLEVAANDPKRIQEVKKKIRHVVLIGNECRMRYVHEMLMEMFKENEDIHRELQGIDPLDPYFIDGVAKGCALSRRYTAMNYMT